MDLIKEKINHIVRELRNVLEVCPYEEAEALIKEIEKAPAVYIGAAGRTGFIMKGFAMRLMHAGFRVYVLGDAGTPAAAAGDLLILGSGSGETGTLKAYARRAGQLGLSVAVITSNAQSSLGACADFVLQIPAPTKYSGPPEGGQDSAQPMGSLFEQALMLYTDALVLELIEDAGIDMPSLAARHANLE